MKKLLLTISLILLTLTPLMAQVNWEEAYNDLLIDYDLLEIDYDTVVESRAELQKRHDQTLAELDVAIDGYEAINYQLSQEAKFHEISKDRIELDQEEIVLLRDNLETMISLADVKMWQVYVQGGLLVNDPAFDLGLNVLIPRTPLAFMFEGNYVVNTGFGVKVGMGVRF